MEFISIFFISLSILVLSYFLYTFKTSKRIHTLIEVLFLGVYFIILLVFIFPDLLIIIENIFGIKNAINFILYLSIFIAYFVIFLLYQKSEKQRVEITKLVREIAYLKRK